MNKDVAITIGCNIIINLDSGDKVTIYGKNWSGNVYFNGPVLNSNF